MDFVSNTSCQVEEMLEVIGAASVEELFSDVPQALMRPRPTHDDGVSEFEGLSFLEEIAATNSFKDFDSYLGGGAYQHHVPSLVSAITQRSEFLTAYTPYQAEASQGLLQTIFEFQSAVSALTGLDAANASVYDSASACAEGVLMALRLNKRRKRVFIAGNLNPAYRRCVNVYLRYQDVSLEEIPMLTDGSLDLSFIESELDEQVAAVLIQGPSFTGTMENIESVIPLIQKAGALSILCANLLTYGLYRSAGEMGIDIAVGDTQALGVPLQFGGPYVGYVACKEKLVRQLPGRLVGETTDSDGKRGFVLTLQAREQHIRREKATSNICSNQALAALGSLVTMLWYGKQGLKDLALTNYQRAAYLKQGLMEIPGVEALSEHAHFNEFALRLPKNVEHVLEGFRKHRIEAGISLERYFSQFENTLLVAVTECKSKEQLDRYISVAREVLQ